MFVTGRDLFGGEPQPGGKVATFGEHIPCADPDCGHWTQQERPEEINAALIRFLKELN
jgi:pimeloyl-ACP methyl ester carboxylesterase